jgi:hypothetical protein
MRLWGVHRGYKESMQGVRKKLLARTAPQGGLLYVGELHGDVLEPKMDHLVCFLPGEDLARLLLHSAKCSFISQENPLCCCMQCS